MESYGGVLSEDNIWRIIVFLRSLNPAGSRIALNGDAARGRALFRGKGNCEACHGVDGKGGISGPDLSRIGRQRSYEYIRASVVDPSADIANGYHTVSIVTQDGTKITGTERGLDNFTVQLFDLSGKFYSFDKDKLRSLKRGRESLMPGNYGNLFTPKDLDDLLAYLSTLRGEHQSQ